MVTSKKDGKESGDSMKQVDTDVSEAEGAGKQGSSKGESRKGAINEEMEIYNIYR